MIDLSKWNDIGRAIASKNSLALTEFHEGRSQDPDLAEDPRGEDLAEAVLQEIIALNRAGQENEARLRFDPAHAPFIPQLEQGGRGLTCCAIIGPDEFLVQQGFTYEENSTWHIKGNTILPLEGIARFAWSRNRKYFVTVHKDGHLTLGHAFGAADAEHIPAMSAAAFIPSDLPDEYAARFSKPSEKHAHSNVSVSDDGNKILLCDEARGILLLARDGAGWTTHLLFPSVDLGLKEEMEEFWEDDENFSRVYNEAHAALSPNGNFAVIGATCDWHHILELDNNGHFSVYAKLGQLADYAFNACFTDDSQHMALTSYRLYAGMTFASALAAVKGLTTEPYELHSVQTMLNDDLRVYAFGYLPAHMTKEKTGAFLLAGDTFAACVTPGGKLLWEVGFGSSAGAVDICPTTKRVLIASYSGMLHLLDLSRIQSPMIFAGYNAPQELRRWIFWDRLDQPIIW